jgi:NAD(P)-dependent dehydrogenase (short-subunit alcohol dehydrogenase family)
VADMRFDGRVAIVTGAGGGLGREHALLLAARGAKVVVNDLGGATDGSGASAEPAEWTARQIQDLGGVAVAEASTVATPQGGQALVDTAVQAFGRVDVVISNAGILRDKAFHNMTSELLDPCSTSTSRARST